MSRIYRNLGTVAMEPKGEYNSSTYYEKLNMVNYEGVTYVAKEAVQGEAPSSSTKWQKLMYGSAIIFDNVAEMKAAASLEIGMTVGTSGYYSANDGGSALYKITNTQSNSEYQETLNNGLYATLIVENNTINISQFGAKGDNETDDYQSFQNALDCNYNIICEKNKTYLISYILKLKENTIIDLNNCTLKTINEHLIYNFLYNDTFTEYNGNGNITIKNGCIDGGSISLIHGKNINISNIEFKNTLNNHYIELCACKDVEIKNCSFTDMLATEGRLEFINIDPCTRTSFPWLSEGNITYDDTVNDNICIHDCVFDKGTTGNLQDAIGSHTRTEYHHTNISIYNNKIDSANRGLMLFDCDYLRVFNNTIDCWIYGIDFTGNKAMITDNIIISTRDTFTAPIHIDTGISHDLFIDNNVGKSNNNNFKYHIYVESQTDYSFLKSQNLQTITSSVSPVDTVSNVNINKNVTKFNTIEVKLGAVSNGTYKTIIIKSWYDRDFVVNEEFSIPELGSGVTMKIIDSNNLRFNNLTDDIRYLILRKE